MVLEAFSVAAFGAFIWAVTFMVPKAIKQRDGLANTSAVLTGVFSLIAWILASVPLSGTGGQKTDSSQLRAARLRQGDGGSTVALAEAESSRGEAPRLRNGDRASVGFVKSCTLRFRGIAA